MTVIVNNPAPVTSPVADTGGYGFLIGVIAIIGFLVALFYFGIPAMKRMGPVQVSIPAPQVVIPNTIELNVKQAK